VVDGLDSFVERKLSNSLKVLEVVMGLIVQTSLVFGTRNLRPEILAD